ncbi:MULTISPECIES: SH3 domain-containing protein [unclassified Nocardioides]|uniref:SH3 domain-containing protein n=1 Tax=unclassified Nocardioides TaxID=2615069 RepID=UPI0006F9B06F|nr:MULTISPECIES: SH3 domain-containing protein [unclassified Nocardioides]KRA29684.1 hypothetical protein ASD81_22285 [Nocardioides sp. Root614]KRA88140.1 hypothetical protein ASD84_19330 [Nocardioides sp. Root682]
MTQQAHWHTLYGRARRSTARYVSSIAREPYAGTAGDWTFRVNTTTNVRQGPSTKDRTIATFIRGKEFNTRWMTERGESVNGQRAWVSVETSNGRRGWISLTNLCAVEHEDDRMLLAEQ